MPITLHFHPHTRATTALWMLEELGLEHELVYTDLRAGVHRTPEFRAINPMGKVPTLVDGDTVVTEVAAIGMYLADRYSLGELAPAPDDPDRGPYLRWILYGPSVVEPGCYARSAGWDFKPQSAGWGRWDDMLATIDAAMAPARGCSGSDSPWPTSASARRCAS